MSTFYASYTGTNSISVSGSITATNPSVAPTGAAVPADATYAGMNVGGNLTGLTGTASGLKVDGSAVTQPISAVSLPLPTGAATSAKQPALGTAGTASTDVLTVQGIASMTPILVTPAGSGSTQPVNVAQFGGNAVVTGTGASGSGIPRMTVANDSTIGLVAGSAIIGKVGIDQTTPGTTNGVQVNAALPAGTNIVGKVGIDQTTPGTTNGVQVNAALPAGSNIIGKTGIDQTTPGTTNAIQATSSTAATWQAEGSIAAGSVTGSFQTILTPSANTKIVMMRNNTDQSISFSFDAGTTTNFVLDSGDQVAIDYITNGLIAATTAIQIKQTGSAPSTGSVRVNACH